MRRKGRLVVISGPSGVGKTTVCAALARLPGFERVVTCTTRAPRPGEVDGQDYVFLSRPEFEAGIRAGRFLEHAVVHSHCYGTPREPVERGVERGQHMLLNIDVQGATQLRGKLPDGLMTSVFLLPPDDATLARRLEARGTEDPAAVAGRLATARRELEEQHHYDIRVVNDTVTGAVQRILAHLGQTPAATSNPSDSEQGGSSSCWTSTSKKS